MDFVKCSAEKRLSSLVFEENVPQQDEWPHSWEEREISYRLNNFSEDFASNWQIRAITVALRVWQWRLAKLKFRRERNPDVSVDFNVSFAPLEKFRSPNVFAHAYYPGQGEISGDVEINDEWFWVPGSKYQTLSNPPLVPVMVHEFGHSLGLKHDTFQPKSIMYPSFDLGAKKYKLHSNDVARIQDRYTPRNLPQRILDMFAARRLRGGDFR